MDSSEERLMTTSVVHVLRARRVSLGAASLSDAARMFARHSSIHGLAAQFEKAKQHLVTLRRQSVDGAGSRLGAYAIDELLLEFGRQLGRAENFPPSRNGTGELLEEVLDTSLTAAEVIEKDLSHDAPAQSRPPAQRGIYIGNANDSFGDKMIHFPSQRSLQSICDMPRHFFVKADRPFPKRRVKFRSAPDRVLRGLCPADDF